MLERLVGEECCAEALEKGVVEKCWREVFRDVERHFLWLRFSGKAVAARGTRRLTKNKEPVPL